MCRLPIILLLVSLTIAVQAMAPRAACLTVAGATYLAALDGSRLHLASVTATGSQDVALIPADDITTLAVGQFRGTSTLLAARGPLLLRFDLPHRTWITLGKAAAPIREIHPSPDGAATAMLLTGTAGTPVPADGALWWASWSRRFAVTRVTAVKNYFRPWQFWWTRAGGEQRFAVATYKSTHFAPFEHNCMFLFASHGGKAEPRWLGSRLTRPYVDATHANIRPRNQYRMVAVEETKDGGHALGVYRPIGFGFEGEWRTDAIPDLQRVVAFGGVVICWGQTADQHPCAWRLLPINDAYHLVALPEAPPQPEALTRLDATHLTGWWDNAWHTILLPNG